MKTNAARLSELLRTRPASGAPVELLLDSWSGLGVTRLRTSWIDGAGVLPRFTHPNRLANLIAER